MMAIHAKAYPTDELDPPGGGGLSRVQSWWHAVKELVRRLPPAFTRTVHPFRRRLALRALGQRGSVRSVLFVCNGNIFRSPFAAKAFAQALAGGLRDELAIGSAGLIGPGRAAPEVARAAAAARGCDLTSHTSRLLTRADLEMNDLVVVMEPGQRRVIRSLVGPLRRPALVLGDLDEQSSSERAIADPWSGHPDEVAAAYDRILRCVKVLARVVGAGSTSLAAERPVWRTSTSREDA
jgi:protein-tyrosine-phosphatase